MSLRSKAKSVNSRTFNGQQSLNGAVKSICDIMRRSNCAGALQYVPELTWILFLRILDERETRDAETAAAGGSRIPALARGALSLAGLGRSRGREAQGTGRRDAWVILQLRQQ
jgi:hypothetical protein